MHGPLQHNGASPVFIDIDIVIYLSRNTVVITWTAFTGGYWLYLRKQQSEKKQGMSSDNTSILPIIPLSKIEIWLAVIPEPSNREPPNFQLKVRWVCSID